MRDIVDRLDDYIFIRSVARPRGILGALGLVGYSNARVREAKARLEKSLTTKPASLIKAENEAAKAIWRLKKIYERQSKETGVPIEELERPSQQSCADECGRTLEEQIEWEERMLRGAKERGVIC